MAIQAIKAQNNTARIEIVGSIGQWKGSALAFRQSIKDMIDAGIQDAHVYINSGGGECFEANEIVNEIRKFTGKITGEGGALVASAATYIAIACESFSMAENGQFMIHQPSAGAYGRVAEVESALTLLKGMSQTYLDAYLAKTTMKPADFKAKWEAGDFWMTATEAKTNGFVDEVVGKAKINKTTAEMITACGYAGTLVIDEEINNENKEKNMGNLTAQALALGLPSDASETQINAKIAELTAQANRATALENEAASRRNKEIEELLTNAIKDKRITADQKENWKNALTSSFESAKSMLTALQAVAVPAVPTTAKGAVDKGDKTFEQLQEDPEALAKMQEEEPEKFNALFADFEKRNKLK